MTTSKTVASTLGMEDISGFPQFLQDVHQIQNQGDAQFAFDSNLEGTLAVGQGHAGFGASRITARISSATSWMTAVLPLSKLAHTRLFSGRGGVGSSLEVRRLVGNRLSMTVAGCAPTARG